MEIPTEFSAERQPTVSEAEHNTKALSESEQCFRSAFDYAAIGMALVALDGRWLKVNRSLCELLGYSEQELLATNFQNITHPDDLDADLNYVEQLLSGKISHYQMEKRYFHKHGHVVWIILGVSLLRESPQKRTCYSCACKPLYFISQIQDISDRKQAEVELQQTTQLQQAIQDSTNYIIISVALDGTIVTFNRAAERLLGYAASELVGTTTPTIIHDHLEVVEHAQTLSHALGVEIEPGFEAFIAKAKRGEVEEREWSYIRKDGSRFPVLLSITALRDAEGNITGFLGIASDLSEKKQAEKEREIANNQLRESEERWQLAIRGSNDGIWDWNARTNEAFFSTRLKEMLGYEDHEIANHWDELVKRIHPDDQDAVMQAVQDHFAKKTPFYTTEHRVVCKDGTYKWILDRGQALWDEAGNVVRMVGSHTDITKHKQAEELLRQQAQIFNQVHDAVVSTDINGYITSWNKSAERLYGFQEHEVLGKYIGVVYFPHQQKFLQEQVIEPLLKKGTHEVEVKALRKTGEIIPALLWLSLLKDAQGAVIGMVGSSMDITAIKQVEEALRQAKQELELRVQERTAQLMQANEQLREEIVERQQAEAALRQSEQRYRSLVNATTQIVWLTNAQGKVISSIAGWEAFTGQTVDELQGWGWLEMIHPDDREQTYRFWSEALATKTLCEVEYRLRTRDGSYRHCIARGVPVLAADGRVQEWVGTTTDITVQKQAEQLLRNANEELENRVRQRTRELAQVNATLQTEIAERIEAQQKLEQLATELKRSNQELEQFAYVASHDLQEPLRAVTGYTQLLAQEYQDLFDESAQEYMDYVVDGATRMQQLIRDLLAYSRVGTRAQEFAPTDCNQALNQALDNLQVAIAQTSATITHSSLPTLTADNNQLVQLFQNLIGNAIKFQRKGEFPQVHIGVELKDGEWVFTVQDNGIGMKPQYLERIFIIFKRLHTRKEYSGTGIGLAICKKIVERHGGRIWVQSQLGVGTTFYFTIPQSADSLLELGINSDD